MYGQNDAINVDFGQLKLVVALNWDRIATNQALLGSRVQCAWPWTREFQAVEFERFVSIDVAAAADAVEVSGFGNLLVLVDLVVGLVKYCGCRLWLLWLLLLLLKACFGRASKADLPRMAADPYAALAD